MTPKERAAIQQALELMDAGRYIPAMRVLREALAEQAEQGPVAEVVVRPLRGDQSQPTTDIKWLQRPTTGKLYAAPVPTKDLTDEEITNAWESMGRGLGKYTEFARAVIQEYRRKNGIV